MNRALKWLVVALAVAAVLGIGLVVAALPLAGGLEHAVIEIDGHPVALAQLASGEWLAVIGALALALLIVLVVVPVAVLVPMLVAALLLVGALVVVAGVTALAFSPLIALVALVWLIVRLARGRRSDRRRGPRNRDDGSATIAR